MTTSWTSAERMRVLVTVKAYPEIGTKHGETVCVAGIRVDEPPLRWVRLYPVPFRDLPKIRQFRKYQFVELAAIRPPSDRRPESWRINADDIELGEWLDSSAGWKKRRPYVEPILIESMCELRRRQGVDGTSLGAFKPAEVLDVKAKPNEGWSEAKRLLTAQASLLQGETRSELEPIPWEFRYRYKCSTRGCNTHTQKIIDWELGEAWRKWHAESDGTRVEMIRDKWLHDLAGRNKDLVLFAGNMFRYPQNFLVLGAYYPPRDATAQQQFLL